VRLPDDDESGRGVTDAHYINSVRGVRVGICNSRGPDLAASFGFGVETPSRCSTADGPNISAMKAVDQVLTAEEVAKLLKLSTKTVFRLAKQGKIPAFRVGADLRFKREAIEELMRKPKPFDDPEQS
jgi:excisionase family DNA binding protein